VYTLTDKAEGLFPKNINTLTQHMLDELKASLGSEQINVIFDGVAARMASELEPGAPGESFEERLDRVVEHLSEHGYEAHWERHPDGYVLHTTNCPYSGVAEAHDDVCVLDAKYISRLLGTVPRRIGHLKDGETSCAYLIKHSQAVSA
jgi:predicted ArsR family transcriptional regulator